MNVQEHNNLIGSDKQEFTSEKQLVDEMDDFRKALIPKKIHLNYFKRQLI